MEPSLTKPAHAPLVYQERSTVLAYLQLDPRLANLRADPRFSDLLRRVGHPQQ